jgi:hypothetical protein
MDACDPTWDIMNITWDMWQPVIALSEIYLSPAERVGLGPAEFEGILSDGCVFIRCGSSHDSFCERRSKVL